jgi:hypothetical protein
MEGALAEIWLGGIAAEMKIAKCDMACAEDAAGVLSHHPANGQSKKLFLLLPHDLSPLPRAQDASLYSTQSPL